MRDTESDSNTEIHRQTLKERDRDSNREQYIKMGIIKLDENNLDVVDLGREITLVFKFSFLKVSSISTCAY